MIPYVGIRTWIRLWSLGLILGLSGLSAGIAGELTAGIGFVNPRKATSIRQAYRKLLATGNVAPGWTGNVATGNPGTVSRAYQEATLRSVNIFRGLAGLKPVVFDLDLSPKCARAALMMSANNTLSHTPAPGWLFYSPDGAEAAGKSNLFLGVAGASAVPGYVEDDGAGNTAVGHRRWILWSQSRVMGSGNVLGGGAHAAANALWVVPNGPWAAPAMRHGFVAWPYPGLIPNTLVFPRWSFSHPTADLSRATVRVTLNGRAIPVRIVDRGATPNMGDHTLVFEPKGDYTAPQFNGTVLYQAHLERSRRPATYSVTIGNVAGSGVEDSYTYEVTVLPM